MCSPASPVDPAEHAGAAKCKPVPSQGGENAPSAGPRGTARFGCPLLLKPPRNVMAQSSSSYVLSQKGELTCALPGLTWGGPRNPRLGRLAHVMVSWTAGSQQGARPGLPARSCLSRVDPLLGPVGFSRHDGQVLRGSTLRASVPRGQVPAVQRALPGAAGTSHAWNVSRQSHHVLSGTRVKGV